MPFAPLTRRQPAGVKTARKHFYDMGWSYRSAAPLLGVSYQHLCQVLNGERQSRRLITAVLQLPQRCNHA